MEIVELFFLLQFLGVLVILVSKVWNVMNEGRVVDVKVSFLTFAGYFLCWGIGFVTWTGDVENLQLFQLFRLEGWFIALNVVLFVAELFFHIKERAKSVIEPYKANQRV